MEITLAKVPLPCSAVQLESALLRAAHNGHWHDAQVRMDEDESIVIFHEEHEHRPGTAGRKRKTSTP